MSDDKGSSIETWHVLVALAVFFGLAGYLYIQNKALENPAVKNLPISTYGATPTKTPPVLNI